MTESPSTPPMPPRGKITRIAVTYTVNTSHGPRHTFHGLIGMQRYVRPERLRELEDDLTLICEDLLANRPQPATGLPQGVVRVAFGADPVPAATIGAVPGPVAVCRDLLAAVADALDCPPPAGEAGEGVFLRCVRTGRGWLWPRYAQCWRTPNAARA
jgi:cytochrome P450